MSISIDLNADVGEGMNNESQLFPLISSCNIACGGHTGDAETMREVVRIASKHGVKIGAHPSYPDSSNFGRRSIEMPSAALFHTVRNQVVSLQSIAEEHDLPLHHTKPHGALYHDAAKDKKIAEVLIEVMKGIRSPLKLYMPFGSVIANMANQEGVPLAYEVFADRTYHEDLSLVSRDHPKALITDPDEMYEQVYTMVVHHRVKTINGAERPIKADTVCIHGDTPNAIVLAKHLRERLIIAGVRIQ